MIKHFPHIRSRQHCWPTLRQLYLAAQSSIRTWDLCTHNSPPRLRNSVRSNRSASPPGCALYHLAQRSFSASEANGQRTQRRSHSHWRKPRREGHPRRTRADWQGCIKRKDRANCDHWTSSAWRACRRAQVYSWRVSTKSQDQLYATRSVIGPQRTKDTWIGKAHFLQPGQSF